jgi:hydrogenase expression/formation protein HypC
MCLGIPGQVVELIDPQRHIAKVEVSGVRRNVNVGLLATGDDAVEIGDWVLIHVGFALSKIDEEEARATLEFLEQLGDPYEQELAELKTSTIE